ncbi:MAG: hypothetical protein FWE31_03610 [Firmicutes bacterium]|nr:hypothetical protein [Bacillota bacterium]
MTPIIVLVGMLLIAETIIAWLIANLLWIILGFAGLMAVCYIVRVLFMLFGLQIDWRIILLDFLLHAILYTGLFGVFLFTVAFATSFWPVFLAMITIVVVLVVVKFSYVYTAAFVPALLFLNAVTLVIAATGNLPLLYLTSAQNVAAWIVFGVQMIVVIGMFVGPDTDEMDDLYGSEDLSSEGWMRVWIALGASVIIFLGGLLGAFFWDRGSEPSGPPIYFENEYIRHFSHRGNEYIEFGQFYQSSLTETEVIRWRVLRTEGDQMLLLSNDILHVRSFDQSLDWTGDIFGDHDHGLVTVRDSLFDDSIVAPGNLDDDVFHITRYHFIPSPTRERREQMAYGGLVVGRSMRSTRRANPTYFAQNAGSLIFSAWPNRIWVGSYWVGVNSMGHRGVIDGWNGQLSNQSGSGYFFGVRPSIIIDTAVLFV